MRQKRLILLTLIIIKKYSNELLNDISIAYNLAIETNSDLITMPINKYEIKKKISLMELLNFLQK